MVLAVSALGGFLVTFMSSSVNIALPLIEADFHVSAVTLSWISLSYMLTSAVCLLPVGRLADIHGRVRVFTLGMLVFSVLSLASAFAPSAGVLLALRAVHGVGLACGAVTSTALVTLAYPVERRGRALGLTVACVYLGITLGPVLGGLISHNLGWRGLFLVVGGLSLLNVVLPLWKLRHVEWREPKTARFDLLGSVISGAALVALLLGFSLLPESAGAILAAVGVAGLGLFLWWETRAADPLINIDLFRKGRVFAFSNVAALINYASTSAMVFLLSLYLQYNRGLDAQDAGLVLVCGPLVQVVVSPVVGRLTDRMEPRYLATVGMATCVLGLLGLSFVGAVTPYWFVIAMICLVCLGVAFFSTPITHTIMGSVQTRWVGVASATLATMRQVGQSTSQGIVTLVLALEVGRQAIQVADYPQLLTSMRISFLIFTVLGVVGAAATLVGPKRRGRRTGVCE